MISLKNLSVGYDSTLIKDINLELSLGEVVCLTGRNGVGKSSFLKTLCGLEKPLLGDIIIDDVFNPLIESLSKKVAIGIPSQDISYELTVYEFLKMGRFPYFDFWGKISSKDEKIITHYLDYFELESLKDKPLHSLSDGQRQLTFLSRVFIQDTPIIILDEPFTYLDEFNRRKLVELISNKNESSLFIISTHQSSAFKGVETRNLHVENSLIITI